MADIISVLKEFLTHFIELSMVLFELLGGIVILRTVILGFIDYINVKKRHESKLVLAEGFSMGLEILLGGEILRTIVIHELSDILMVGGIIGLRVCLTVLHTWESKQEKAEEETRKAKEARKEE